jgi:methylase of polypeptide subunit release factors
MMSAGGNMVSGVIPSVYDELIEYLAQMATPEQILAFKVSEAAQERVDDLLERNNEGELTSEEQAELQQILHFDRIVSLMKARAARSQSST